MKFLNKRVFDIEVQSILLAALIGIVFGLSI